MRKMNTPYRNWSAALAVLLVLSAWQAAQAQPEASERLTDQEPFDRITLDEENQNAVIKVEPLNIPGRRMPDKVDPDAVVRVKLFAQPDKTYAIKWRHIKRIDFYEDLLLQEANRYISEDKLDDAYDTLQHLKENFPKARGVEGAIQAYLYISAGRLFRQEEWAEALAVLEELHRLNPNYRLTPDARPLSTVFAAVLERMLSGYVERGEFRAARALLTRIKRDYGEEHAVAVASWETRLNQLAAKEQVTTREALAADKLRAATLALRRMNEIWPAVAGGAELTAQVAARYPIVIVGVSQEAKSLDALRLDDWAARRAGRLTSRQLMEFVRPGPEGGQYNFRFGSFQLSEDRRRLSLVIDGEVSVRSELSGFDLANRLLAMARPDSPQFSPTWANIFSGVVVRDVLRVDVELSHSYVVPQAALQVPWQLPGDERPDPLGALLFSPAQTEDSSDRSFVALDRPPGASYPAEIVERVFSDPTEAIAALRRGEVDMIDRVFPADVGRLQGDANLKVGAYIRPVLHFLVPSPQRPLANNRTIRRALLYGIHRELILNNELLGGTGLRGCRVISGPFSPGINDSDPLAYAVDPQLTPRAYDPRLSLTLASLARRELEKAAEAAGEKAHPLNLVIGYPSSPTARVACQAMVEQLALVGLNVTLKALPPGETRDVDHECDFTYTEVFLQEPVVDARRLLAHEGVAQSSDPYIALALRRLDEAANWTEVRDRLKDIHRIVHTDLTIIPLWQTVEYYAVQKNFRGLQASPVSLYQDVESWNVGPATAAAATAAGTLER